MGKKKGTAGSSATASAAKVGLDWSASTISKREENKMRSLGLISSVKSDFVHPGTASRPRPPKGFTVMFVAFLFRGLSLPAHVFLRSLLFFYGIQLWQLTPNSILHLSIFITLCEAFLGIDPHWGLWRKIFYVKRHNGNDGPPVVGGVGFVVRKEVNYFNYPMKDSVQGWRQKWFYLWDILASGRRSNVPPFKDVLVVVPKKSWQNTLTTEESALADQLYEKVLDLKNAGGHTMCGTEVVSVFLKRRVQPVMSRAYQLWIDILGDEAPEDYAIVKSMRRRRINEDLMMTAESSPSVRDDDADAAASPAPSQEMSAAQVTKGSTRLFAEEEDDLDSEYDDDVPLSKRAKVLSGKAEYAKESTPSIAELTLPPRTGVTKVPLSTVNPSASASAPLVSCDHSENVQLRKVVKTSADQVLEANRLTAEAQNQNTILKDELKKLKKKMKDEQEARRKAFIETDEKEGALRESIASLLSTADMRIDRTNKLRVDSMSDALSFSTESSNHPQDLLKNTKGDLSKLFSMMFPKLDQNKTLGEMADTFFVDSSEAIELSKVLPVDADNCLVNLEPFKQSSVLCANRLLKLVEEDKNKTASEAAPGSSAQT
ncbi:hypothetical protein QYE76_070673 [Lolium multiflorum]|uniref:Transposase (putative) gypsy type domain-containing protein n=1 Tax=Lolium multiflorum TaxID=4521 RepID=A0AAD8SJT1_LOLMU|nr:hypothetical protein QYE76_070673 [Lolium multiflorum]